MCKSSSSAMGSTFPGCSKPWPLDLGHFQEWQPQLLWATSCIKNVLPGAQEVARTGSCFSAYSQWLKSSQDIFIPSLFLEGVCVFEDVWNHPWLSAWQHWLQLSGVCPLLPVLLQGSSTKPRQPFDGSVIGWTHPWSKI